MKKIINFLDGLEKGKKARKKKTSHKIAKGVIAGAGIAAASFAAGVLLAPKSGKENREDFAKVGKCAMNKVNKAVCETKGKVVDLVEAGKEKCHKKCECKNVEETTVEENTENNKE